MGRLKALAVQYLRSVLLSEDVRRRIVDFAAQKVEQHVGVGLGGLALKTYRLFNEDDFRARIEQAVLDIPSSVAVFRSLSV